MRKLSRAGVALAGAGLGLLAAGMGTGNVELIVLSVFPLALLAVSLTTPRSTLRATRSVSTRTPRRSDPVDVAVDLYGLAPASLVETHALIPDGFALETGTNLVLHTGGAPSALRFRARAHARGRHEVGALTAEAIDPRGLLAPESVDLLPPEAIEVTPRPARTDRLRRRRSRHASALPGSEDARLGAGSMDFRELRDYAWGDPPKAINWRATARRMSASGARATGAVVPLVNEYEREGRASMIILLDGGPQMRVGTTLETGVDHAVEAALTAARMVLDKGARVGGATYRARAPPPTAPDAGAGQMPNLERALSPGDPDESITAAHALQSLEPYVAGTKPLVLVVTRVTADSVDDLLELATRVRLLARERRQGLPLVVLDVDAMGLASGLPRAWRTAARIVEAEDAKARARLAAAGARVATWRPGREDVRSALVQRGLA